MNSVQETIYDESKILTLSSLEHIRLRPGMYIGRLGNGSHPSDGIYVLLKEIVDNSIDEFIMGFGKRIDIRVENGAVNIRDFGRGIPLGKLVECVSIINTGAKYNDEVFQFSVGLNGVGTKAVNALSNSTTNSYKRLIPGFEAPVLLVYSVRNRSATCRIPIALNKKGLRVEVRYPDGAGNPYLTFAAMLMAGMDGIKNKIDPGKPLDDDLYALPENKVKKIPTVCGSLREAMECLDRDRDFLKQGSVFTDDQIDAYIALKFEEIHKLEHTPHPIEFEMYYSC